VSQRAAPICSCMRQLHEASSGAERPKYHVACMGARRLVQDAPGPNTQSLPKKSSAICAQNGTGDGSAVTRDALDGAAASLVTLCACGSARSTDRQLVNRSTEQDPRSLPFHLLDLNHPTRPARSARRAGGEPGPTYTAVFSRRPPRSKFGPPYSRKRPSRRPRPASLAHSRARLRRVCSLATRSVV